MRGKIAKKLRARARHAWGNPQVREILEGQGYKTMRMVYQGFKAAYKRINRE